MEESEIRILIIEDDEDDFILTKSLLQEIPHRLFCIEWEKDYQKALKKMCAGIYSLYLVDYRLGKYNGLELLKEASRKGCAGTVIMLTGENEGNIDMQAMRLGAADYLVKGKIDAAILERSIRYSLERAQAQAERSQLVREQIARVESEVAQAKFLYLAHASNMFSSALDEQTIINSLVKLAAPYLCDWCVVDIKEHDIVKRAAIYSSNKKQQEYSDKLQNDFPLTMHMKKNIVVQTIETGKATVLERVTDSDLVKTARNAEHLAILRKGNLQSHMIVPLHARDETFGAVTFVSTNPNRRYTKADLVFAQDLTHRAALAIDNARLYQNSQEGIRVRDEFLNIASHELKTPLTSLQLQMQILQRRIHQPNTSSVSTSDMNKMLKISIRQTKRLAQLINNLLDVSRLSSKKLELEKQKVNLSQIVTDVVERFSDQTEASGSKIRLYNGIHAEGDWDLFRIDQVATNLISNALKYGEGKPIIVRVEKDSHTARLVVQDQGIGIAKEDLTRIFNRFERTKDAKKYGGLGLGLYIVQEIVNAHQGKIMVKSDVGKGAKFIVELPIN